MGKRTVMPSSALRLAKRAGERCRPTAPSQAERQPPLQWEAPPPPPQPSQQQSLPGRHHRQTQGGSGPVATALHL